MFEFLDETARQFRLEGWRYDNACRNELTRAAALHAIDHGLTDLKGLTKKLKAIVQFHEMSPPDRNNFYQMPWRLKRIVEVWDLLDPLQQTEFRAGKIRPSTLAARAKSLTQTHRRSNA